MNPTDLLSGIRITDVWRALGGPDLKAAGPERFRGTAWWRKGDSYAISLNDGRGVWHDFVAGVGGGILDLVIQVRGGTRREALEWLARTFDLPLKSTAFSTDERGSWARQRRELEQDLPSARLWHRAAIAMGEELLANLKASFFDKSPGSDVIGFALQEITRAVAQWHCLAGADMVGAYRWWRQRYPELTGAMLAVTQMRQIAERRALCRFLGIADPEAGH